jgi:hypothetical protein
VREQKPMAKPKKRSVLNIFLGLMLGLLLVCFLTLFMVTWRPGFYREAGERSRQRLYDDAYDFNKKLEKFFSNVWSERAQPLEITEDEVNGYLAAVNDPAIWENLPIKFESWRKIFVSDWLRNVQVSFRDGRVTVAGEVTWHDYNLILSVVGVPVCDREGKARLRVTSIWAGMLPLPKSLFRQFLKDIDDRPVQAKFSRWRLREVAIRDGKATLIGEIVPEKVRE